jgi:5-hydroxyisourate hydrolase-like protein (transthyretin family)
VGGFDIPAIVRLLVPQQKFQRVGKLDRSFASADYFHTIGLPKHDTRFLLLLFCHMRMQKSQLFDFMQR